MDSFALIIKFQSNLFHLKPTLNTPPLINLPFPISKPYYTSAQFRRNIKVKVSLSSNASSPEPIIRKLRTAAAAVVFAATAASMIGKFQTLPARAETQQVLSEELTSEEEKAQEKDFSSSALSEFVESNSEAIQALKKLLEQKLESGEDEESLKILKDLVSAQPDEWEWKILMARLLNEMGETQKAQSIFEEILSKNPLSFEALFENALLMDRNGEGEEVNRRLEEALKLAEEESKAKEARDVRLIIAQIQFLQKNVEEALRSYEELTKEDPDDFRPYFCKGMIYSLLDKNAEAAEQFAKYRELSPKKFDVEGYLRTPLLRMKPFGTGNEDNLN